MMAGCICNIVGNAVPGSCLAPILVILTPGGKAVQTGWLILAPGGQVSRTGQLGPHQAFLSATVIAIFYCIIIFEYVVLTIIYKY